MTDPITTPLMAKLLTGISGLIGGVAFMAFYRPCNVWDAAVRSGLSVTSAVVFTPIIMEWTSLTPSMDNAVAISAGIGFSSWSLLSLAAHLLIGVQDEKVSLKLPFIERKDS